MTSSPTTLFGPLFLLAFSLQSWRGRTQHGRRWGEERIEHKNHLHSFSPLQDLCWEGPFRYGFAFFFFETASHNVAHDALELWILLAEPKCLDYSHMPPHPAIDVALRGIGISLIYFWYWGT